MSSKIVVFDVTEIEGTEEDSSRSRSSRSRGGVSGGPAVRAIDVNVEELSDNLVGFVETVRGMLARVAAREGSFAVEKVEVQAQISGEGKVGFMGNGVKASGGASIKIVLERRKDREPEK